MKTRAQYLTARGWMPSCDNDSATWWDACDGGEGMYSIDDAVIVQRARDAKEERAAWVAFAAAGPPDPSSLGCLSDLDQADRAASTAQWADDMLATYRARFAAPARFDDEVA